MKAIIYQGGWDGHTPVESAAVFAKELRARKFKVDVVNKVDALLDVKKLKTYDLVVPMWTMADAATITNDHVKNLSDAVRSGVGLAGWHGGMGDSVRHSLNYMWMTGGQFIDHPHVGDYIVRVIDHDHPATAALPYAFAYKSEQYYMAFEPSIDVLAVTDYCWDGDVVEMPVVWTKHWGKGRVFYSALGHIAQEFTDYPHVREMITRGLVWAAEGKALA